MKAGSAAGTIHDDDEQNVLFTYLFICLFCPTQFTYDDKEKR